MIALLVEPFCRFDYFITIAQPEDESGFGKRMLKVLSTKLLD